MKQYAIYINSESMNMPRRWSKNCYGYWTGKFYTIQGEIFPCHTSNDITEETKIYSSRKRAENAANNIATKCGYVYDCEIEEISE